MRQWSMSIILKVFLSEAGQTIIEAVVALSALLLTLSGISIAIVTSVNNTTFIKNQNQANKFAQQGIEVFRNLQANNSTITLVGAPTPQQTFSQLATGVYCLGDSSTVLVRGPCTVNLLGTFIRQVDIDTAASACTLTGGGNQTSVTVTVRWSSQKCGSGTTDQRFCHTSVMTTCLSSSVSPTPVF